MKNRRKLMTSEKSLSPGDKVIQDVKRIFTDYICKFAKCYSMSNY